MKSLILLFLFAVCLSTSLFAADTSVPSSILTSENDKSELQILDLVVGIKRTYSQTSQLDAKVVELLGGDGMNSTRMVLILNTGYQDTKIYSLGIMMYEVRRIVFLDKDVVVINYTQDSFKDDEAMTPIQVNKSITIQVLRNADGTLANTVKVLE